MTDLALAFTGDGMELVMDGYDLATDDGLQSAVAVSLFTDARCEAHELPVGETSRRGYWGDTYGMAAGDATGSKLWLLSREKTINATLARARDYALQALAWLTADKVAASVDVEAEYISRGVLALHVSIARPTGARASFRYDYTWQAQAAAVPSTTARTVA